MTKEVNKLDEANKVAKEAMETLVKGLKEQHKDVYVLKVDMDDEADIYGFFRKPTFNEFRRIYPLMQKGDDLMADKILLETCWLGGDPRIQDVDNNLEIFLSVKSDLSQLIDLKASSLKKK